MDASYLESVYTDALATVQKHSKYRLNFGIYYTPRF